ncbi:MAG: hypothetical protein GY950_25675 [bacterium]|nr:hypothetical protein [bacterium]
MVKKQSVLFAVAILGFLFWLVSAFPFANRNESYNWIVQLNGLEFHQTFVQKFPCIKSLRPLSQAAAWVGYHFSGGSIYPVQVLNVLLLLAAWFIIFLKIKEKRAFSMTLLVMGGFFFSGFYYVFHLHGIFYSPLILFMAILYYWGEKAVSHGNILKSFILTLIFALVHPFALVIYVFYLVGRVLEKWGELKRSHYISAFSVVLFSILLMKILVPGKAVQPVGEYITALLTTLENVELGGRLGFISFLLAISQAACLRAAIPKVLFVSAVSAVVVLSLTAYLVSVPVISILIVVCLLKTIVLKRWPLAFLIFASLLFPVVALSGSATKGCFLLTALAIAVPMDCGFFEERKEFLTGKISLLLFILVLGAAVCLRAGVSLPVVSGLVSPVLAEREKTFQLENIIQWLPGSAYKDHRLKFYRSSLDTEAYSVSRKKVAPTRQAFLDEFLNQGRGKELIVCFGGEEIEGAVPVYSVGARYGGDAVVYLPADDPFAVIALF